MDEYIGWVILVPFLVGAAGGGAEIPTMAICVALGLLAGFGLRFGVNEANSYYRARRDVDNYLYEARRRIGRRW